MKGEILTIGSLVFPWKYWVRRMIKMLIIVWVHSKKFEKISLVRHYFTTMSRLVLHLICCSYLVFVGDWGIKNVYGDTSGPTNTLDWRTSCHESLMVQMDKTTTLGFHYCKIWWNCWCPSTGIKATIFSL